MKKNAPSKLFFVYILGCNDGTLYVGSTTDLDRRLHAHNHLKSGAHYTKIRRPVILKYSESFPKKSAALKREHELKQLSHFKKMELVKIKKAVR